jgi:tryptophan synthase beta chain
MQLLGARVEPVDAGARTLKEAVSAAIRDWVSNVAGTHYIIGSCVGPAPYPALVRDLQRVIGDEARSQVLARDGRLPQRVIACVGGGSNSIGMFIPFAADDDVELVGVEAAGEGIETGRHGAPLTAAGVPGVLHGAFSAVMQDEDGQILEAHSISAGLDYPGSGPEHAWLRDSGRARYVAISDRQALDAFALTARLEGIVPALERARARLGDGQRTERARPGLPVGPGGQGPGRGAGPDGAPRPTMTGRATGRCGGARSRGASRR